MPSSEADPQALAREYALGAAATLVVLALASATAEVLQALANALGVLILGIAPLAAGYGFAVVSAVLGVAIQVGGSAVALTRRFDAGQVAVLAVLASLGVVLVPGASWLMALASTVLLGERLMGSGLQPAQISEYYTILGLIRVGASVATSVVWVVTVAILVNRARSHQLDRPVGEF